MLLYGSFILYHAYKVHLRIDGICRTDLKKSNVYFCLPKILFIHSIKQTKALPLVNSYCYNTVEYKKLYCPDLSMGKFFIASVLTQYHLKRKAMKEGAHQHDYTIQPIEFPTLNNINIEHVSDRNTRMFLLRTYFIS